MNTISLRNMNRLGLACAALGFQAAPLSAATIFLDDEAAVASAEWEIWSWGNESDQNVTGASGSQGAAQTLASNGTIAFTSTDVSTGILLGFDNPPGGFLGNPDTFYIFNGAFEWSVSGTFDADVDFVRVSYSLAGVDEASAFPNGPSLNVDATEIRSGTYQDGDSAVFFTDFEFTAPSSSLVATFADFPIPHSSHRSMDAIRIEGFSGTAPSAIPEPSTYALGAGLGALGLVLLRRRFRRTAASS